MFSLDIALPQVFDIAKDKKNHTYKHEIVLEFCVRFASIFQMSNEMKFWTTVKIMSPYLLTPLDEDMFWQCTFCIAVNTM